MRRLAVLVAAAALAGPAAATTPSTPTVRPLSLDPVVVMGRSFQPLERVKVTVATADGQWARRIVATARGSFTVRFPDVTMEVHCGFSGSISAVGSKGSRAAWKVPPMECPPPLEVQ
jgi:hypothetical protein